MSNYKIVSIVSIVYMYIFLRIAKLIITTLLQVWLINLLSPGGNGEIIKKETVNSVLQES